MPIAALPAYLGNDFHEASPGLRFGMYLKLWGVNRRTQALLWKKHDLAYKVSGQQHQEREYEEKNIVPALKEATSLSKRDRDAMSALAHRQSAQAVTFAPDNLLSLAALATAPFTTGLGNEHPLLPYLPGSGVKGVLRQAARELAGGDWGDAKGWSERQIYTLMQGEGAARKAVLDDHTKLPVKLSMLDALFGLESDDGGKVHVRGALAFWDVIPQIKGDSLARAARFRFHLLCGVRPALPAPYRPFPGRRRPLEGIAHRRFRTCLPMARFRRQDGGGLRSHDA